MKIYRFEDLECWKQAKNLLTEVYTITKHSDFSKDFRLRDQIIGAAISIVNNIAEGFDSQSNSEFIRFLTYSRRSVSEVQNCLYIALDQKYIDEATKKELYEDCLKTRQIIDGLLRYLRCLKRAKRD